MHQIPSLHCEMRAESCIHQPVMLERFKALTASCSVCQSELCEWTVLCKIQIKCTKLSPLAPSALAGISVLFVREACVFVTPWFRSVLNRLPASCTFFENQSCEKALLRKILTKRTKLSPLVPSALANVPVQAPCWSCCLSTNCIVAAAEPELMN